MRSPSATALQPRLNTGRWPLHRTEILDWLMTETRGERFIDNIFVAFCERLRGAGVPVARATLSFETHNPQWLGARILWQVGLPEAEIATFDYDIVDEARYLNSPAKEIGNGAEQVRQRLEGLGEQGSTYPFYHELQAAGLTDYVAWPLHHTLGKQHMVSFAADRPGGFTENDLTTLADLLPALALVSEIRIKNRLARTLLETYVGPHASEQILAGATRRGSGVTVGAAILICDLRDFTTISQLWPRDHVIGLLNGYFDAMSEPIERNGGEILKFIGDGLLAIFPLSNPTACMDLLRAVVEARTAMFRLNAEQVAMGRDPLGYGIGVHVGDVMYGNIGSSKRLDFTVIGPAVNIASRLENLTKELKHQALFSRSFVEMAGCEHALQSLGFHPLRGLGEPVEVFTLMGHEHFQAGP